MSEPVVLRQTVVIRIYVIGFTLFVVGASIAGLISATADAPIYTAAVAKRAGARDKL
jgi:hypothetical protein